MDGINLHLREQDYCVIIGSNGSGKSTLFKVISGEYSHSSGKITLSGVDIGVKTISERARYISSVSQNVSRGTVGELSVMENIALSNMRMREAGFSYYNQNKAEIERSIKSLGLGLEHLVENKISDLSGGQRQAIATLMAVHPKPQLLLLDEHTSALDPKSREKVMEFTDKIICSNHLTAMMITHNIQDALRYGNRLIVMSQGRVVRDFNAEEKGQLTENKILDVFHQSGDLL